MVLQLWLLLRVMPIKCIKKNTTYKSKKNGSRQCLLKDKIIRHIKLRTSLKTTTSVDSPLSASPAAFFAADTSITMGGSSSAASFVGGKDYYKLF